MALELKKPDDHKPTPEETFREIVEDCAKVVEHLAGCCDTPAEMVGMLKLAATNDGQLRLLMALMDKK